MPPYCILNHGKHHITPVRIELVALGEEDRIRIINRPPRRKNFARVMQIKANKVADLLTFQIRDEQIFSLMKNE